MKKFLSIAFFIFWLQAEAQTHIDTIQLNVEWKGIKTIEVEDGSLFKTIDLESALFLPEYNFLPLIEHSFQYNEKITQVDIIDYEIDSTSLEEVNIIYQLRTNSPITSFRNIQLDNKVNSSLLFFPFVIEQQQGIIVKLKSVQLAITFADEINAPKTLNPSNKRTASSLLADNDWYKIAVLEDGIYKLSKTFLDQLGIDTDRINPKKIKILGNGGGMLPQENSAFRYDGLNENAIKVVGESDGIFDDGDYVLFYGQSQHQISIDENSEINYSHNIYSDTTYYFISATGSDGLRIADAENVDGSFPVINSYDDLQFYETNEYNILNSGREWLGHWYSAILSRNYAVDTKNVIPNSEASLIVSALGLSAVATTLDVKYNGEEIGAVSFAAIPKGSYLTKGFLETEAFDIVHSGNIQHETIMNLSFNKISGEISSAYLNYFIFKSKKSLIPDNRQLVFRSVESLNNPFSTFQLNNAETYTIWDISDHLNPMNQKFNRSGSTISFSTLTSELKTFIAFDPSNSLTPIPIGQIPNQNIRDKNVPDLIIVSHPNFVNEANRLADHRRSFDGLDVQVFTTSQIYNEFSSGSPDVTAIRDMVKYFYDKGNQQKLKNLLLFGRGSFDYKDRIKFNTNFVPIYSSRNFTNPVSTYSSDDYFAFLEDDEGEWQETYSGDHTMDIGVGRLPVTTSEQAKIIVDKLINYSLQPENLGEWKNEIFFIADDGDGNLHQRDADKLATLVDTTYTNFNVNKIYVDAYEQVITEQGEKAPEANIAVNNAIEKGGIIFNFTGHGSETRLCSETIIDIDAINSWENNHRLPLFVTATCEFGRHDDPRIISGGEQLLLSKIGGAIGLVTTARPVYSNSNYQINQAFYNSVFEKKDLQYQDLGTIFKNTKNNSLRGSFNRNFILLGDPSMKLAFPENEIQIIAEASDSKVPGDTLGALEKIKLTGKIIDLNGSDLTSFNGILTAKVYDKLAETQTFGNESDPFTYKVRNSLLFNGDVTVENGIFSFEFVVPKNIPQVLENGKVSLYAQNQDQLEAAGSEVNFVIGGAKEAEVDNKLPEITLFINDTSFINGGLTGSNVKVLASIFDENGISLLQEDLNDGIILTLDDGSFKYVGDYFKNELNTYQKGWLNYPINELEEGLHTVTVGAYDTHNNYNEANIEFHVMESSNIFADKLINFPNPLRDYTNFSFEHNRAGEDLELNIQVFDMTGRFVFNGFTEFKNSPGKIDNIHWNARSSSGKKLEPGVYVYMIRIRSLKDESNYFLKSKLLIIN